MKFRLILYRPCGASQFMASITFTLCHGRGGNGLGLRGLAIRIAPVKITYGISLPEFRTLQPPPRHNPGRTAFWLIAALVCLSLVLPGAGVVLQQASQQEPPPAAALAS